MKDVQNELDNRNMPINKVGIKDLRYPLTVLDRQKSVQHTIATINMYVDLPHQYKGTHMSRFVEMLHVLQPEISVKRVEKILDKMMEYLQADSAHIEINFPYFIEKTAPVSDSKGFMDYDCRFLGSSYKKGETDIITEIHVPISSVCPCSKEISDYGAHNQRGEVSLSIRFNKFIWIEDLIELVEKCASCDVYSVLKRVDEKYVTEYAYQNPKFVEDIVRDVALELKKNNDIKWFSVSAENFESIHHHSAYAQITSDNTHFSRK
ncbi:GTP cyclohydrolase FolE2 [Candidatus Magnetomorum sp. HK-1]|nr:GTP cyclohydrolase FolE2 [Candidatus Magnetomorum sp. HK-1]